MIAPAKGAIARNARQHTAAAFELAISKHGLGVELAAPFSLGAFRVTTLRADLPGLRFPLDVTGGLARFRSHRTVLNLLRLDADLDTLSVALSSAATGTLAKGAHQVTLRGHEDHVSVSLKLDKERAWDDTPSPVLAFDVYPLIEGGSLSLCVSNARGHALVKPARELALGLMSHWTAAYADRIGGSFAFDRLANELATELFVPAGMRAPRVPAAGLSFETSATSVSLLIDTRNIDTAPSEAAARVAEHLRLFVHADDALAVGDAERAREALLDVLARAPRHAEASATLATIDALYTHRWEAALSSLQDAGPLARSGTLSAELYARRGERERAAREATLASNGEADGELAARALAMAVRHTPESMMAPMWLDEMVSLAPAWTRGRLLRMTERLRRGDTEGARGDAEHAEASVRGARRSFEMCRSLGRLWSDAGYLKEAGAYFERALMFAPEDAETLGALGESLLRRGLRKRGLQLLREAIDRGDRALVDVSPSRIALARGVAESSGDIPTAISIVRDVPDSSLHAPRARAAEARWLVSLSEYASASVSWARYAHLAVARGDASLATALYEAIDFERDIRRDVSSAKHLARAGLQLLPGDPTFLSALNGVAFTPLRDLPPAPAPREMSPPPDTPPLAVSTATSAPSALVMYPDLDEAEASARVEDLTVDLRRNPNDRAVVDELVHHLTRLGRAMDLLALLSARLEEADAAQRRIYLPDTVRVYRQLAAHALSTESSMEAELYESAAKMLEDEMNGA